MGTLSGYLTYRPDLLNVRNIDIGCLPLLTEMERVGTAINIPGLQSLGVELTDSMRDYESKIRKHIPVDKLRELLNKPGDNTPPSKDDPDSYSSDKSDDTRDPDLDKLDLLSGFNVNSSEKVAWLLFDILGLGRGKSLKTSGDGKRISTGKKQLEMLKDEHEVVGLLLKYREVSKLKTTYVDKLPKIAIRHDKGLCSVCGLRHREATHRIHTEFPTTRTETGRPACSAAWTPVLTKRGTVQIKDVRVGDYVWTHKLRWRKVTATWTKGISPMFDVIFSNGDTLTCTADHKLLVLDHEYIQTLDGQREQCGSGTSSIPTSPMSDASRNRGYTGNYLPYNPPRLQNQYSGSGVQSTKRDSLLPIQGRGEESNVREDRRSTPQLAWPSGRWVRVSDLLTQWQAPIRSQDSNGSGSWNGGIAGYIRSTPHRRKPEEQQSGQLSISHSERTQGNTLSATEGFQIIGIEEIKDSGCYEVYDITVDEDESYLTCSVFSHNSRNPNLQNIPARTELGKRVRACFIPTPGLKWVSVDESQIELRALAHCAREETMLQIYRDKKDIHIETARKAFGLGPNDPVDPDMHRAPSKTVNFGVVYGMSAAGLFAQLVFMFHFASKPVPSWLTEQWCQEFIERWFSTYPMVRGYMQRIYRMLRRYGFVWNEFGFVRQIHAIWSAHRHLQSEAERQAGNMPIQGFAAILMKLWMNLVLGTHEGEGYLYEWRELGECNPLLTVHDELNFETDPSIAELVKEVLAELVEFIGHELGLLCPLMAEGKTMDYWKK